MSSRWNTSHFSSSPGLDLTPLHALVHHDAVVIVCLLNAEEEDLLEAHGVVHKGVCY